MEKYNEIQLTKNKMDLNNRKIKNRPPSPSYEKIVLMTVAVTKDLLSDMQLFLFL